MENFNKKRYFWTSIGIYILSLLIIIKGSSYGTGYPVWTPNNIEDYKPSLFTTSFSMLEYHLLPYFFRFSILYVLYLLITFRVVPSLEGKKNVGLTIGYLLFSYIITGIVISITNTYLQVYRLYHNEANEIKIYYHFFFEAFLYVSLIFFFYVIYAVIKIQDNKKRSLPGKQQKNVFLEDCLLALSLWTLVLSFLYNLGLPDDYTIFWLCTFLIMIPLYGYYTIKLIPSIKQRHKTGVLLLGPCIPAILLCSTTGAIVYSSIQAPIGTIAQLKLFVLFILVNIIFHGVITLPASWFLYNYRVSKRKELVNLKASLNQSTANIDLLRSQINPHFLFNTLNSLYGTALLEQSKQTALGIQKLGDMMRFMLHDNQQERILLTKEIAYIKNYIELQKLRIPAHSDVKLEVDIADPTTPVFIAPMLLIPFIENAFKYGISNTLKSWISIILRIDDDNLLFEVNNSIHAVNNLNSDSIKSGTGLENVKQRLMFTYPNQHTLEVSTSLNEFSIKLSLNLTVV